MRPEDRATFEGGGTTGGGVTFTGGGTVYVAPPPPPQPIVVEVLLGVSLFGGALDLRVDPSMLPLARFAGAARVEMRLEGPSAALDAAEARVRAVVDAEGKRLDAVVRVPTNGSQVRAIFTVWPPGAR